MKALIGITSNGILSFASELCCGSISDPDIVKRSSYLNNIQRGDSATADKVFIIRDQLIVVRGRLILSRLLPKEKEVEHNKKIASLRIHV